MASQRESRANKSKLENDNGMADLRSFELALPTKTTYYRNMRTVTNIQQFTELMAGAKFLVTVGKVGNWRY